MPRACAETRRMTSRLGIKFPTPYAWGSNSPPPGRLRRSNARGIPGGGGGYGCGYRLFQFRFRSRDSPLGIARAVVFLRLSFSCSFYVVRRQTVFQRTVFQCTSANRRLPVDKPKVSTTVQFVYIFVESICLRLTEFICGNHNGLAQIWGLPRYENL